MGRPDLRTSATTTRRYQNLKQLVLPIKMSTSHNSGTAGGSAGNALKEGAAKIHGLGEAIRGNINEFADNATGSDPTKSRNIAARGVDEVETGKYAGTGAGRGQYVYPWHDGDDGRHDYRRVDDHGSTTCARAKGVVLSPSNTQTVS